MGLLLRAQPEDCSELPIQPGNLVTGLSLDPLPDVPALIPSSTALGPSKPVIYLTTGMIARMTWSTVNAEKGLLGRSHPQEFQAGVWHVFVDGGWGSVHPGAALSKPSQKIPVEVATPRGFLVARRAG